MSSRPSRGAARLAAILDALSDGLVLVNCNGTVVNANTIALELFETPGTALVGRGLLDLLPTFDSRLIPGSMRRPEAADERGRTRPTRMIARRTDGSEFPVEVTSAGLEDGRAAYDSYNGGFTGDELLMLIVRDLSGTVDTEAELARSQRQTEMILRAAAEGVVGTDTDGRVVLVNPAAAQILGFRASDLGGQELHPLILHSREDGKPFPYAESPLADTLRSGRKHRVRGQVLWAKNGSRVPVDLTTAPVRDGDQLVGAVMTFTDRRPSEETAEQHASEVAALTERYEKELAETTERYEKQLADTAERHEKQLAETTERFTAEVADRSERYSVEVEGLEERHEELTARHGQLTAVLGDSLRGPLEELRTELGTLAADPAGQLWPEANQLLHHLAAGYARMTTLIDNVLGFQQLGTGREPLRKSKALLDSIVAAGIDGAVELIGPGRVQFAVHAPAIEAEVDAVRLATALAHLVADVAGVDSTGKARLLPDGGFLDSTIVVAAAQRGDVVRIEVRGPFSGGDPVHEPIVRGIVGAHDGVIQTHEVPGMSGSAYVLELPIGDGAGAPAGRPGAVKGGAAARPKAVSAAGSKSGPVRPAPDALAVAAKESSGASPSTPAGMSVGGASQGVPAVKGAPAPPQDARAVAGGTAGTTNDDGPGRTGDASGLPEAETAAAAAGPAGPATALPASGLPGAVPGSGSVPGSVSGPTETVSGPTETASLPAGAVPAQAGPVAVSPAEVAGDGAEAARTAVGDGGGVTDGGPSVAAAGAVGAAADATVGSSVVLPEQATAETSGGSGRRRARRGSTNAFLESPLAGQSTQAGQPGQIPAEETGPPTGRRRAVARNEQPNPQPNAQAGEQAGEPIPAQGAHETLGGGTSSGLAVAGPEQGGAGGGTGRRRGRPSPAEESVAVVAPGAVPGAVPASEGAVVTAAEGATGRPALGQAVPPQGVPSQGVPQPVPAQGPVQELPGLPGSVPALAPASAPGAPQEPGAPQGGAPAAGTSMPVAGTSTAGAPPALGAPQAVAPPQGAPQASRTAPVHQGAHQAQGGPQAGMPQAGAPQTAVPVQPAVPMPAGAPQTDPAPQTAAPTPGAPELPSAPSPAPGLPVPGVTGMPGMPAPVAPAPPTPVPASGTTPPVPAPAHPQGEAAQAAGRRARRALAPAPAEGAETGRTAFALPPAEADRTPQTGTAGTTAPANADASLPGRHDLVHADPDADHTQPQHHPAPTGRRRARPADGHAAHEAPETGTDGAGIAAVPAIGDDPAAAAHQHTGSVSLPLPPLDTPAEPHAAEPHTAGPHAAGPHPAETPSAEPHSAGQPLPAQPLPAEAPLPADASHGRAFSVRTLGQGVNVGRLPGDQSPQQPGAQQNSPAGQPSLGSGRRRKLATPPGDERPDAGARPHPHAVPQPPQSGPRLSVDRAEGRAYAIGAPDEDAAEGPEPLDGPGGAVEVTNRPQPQPVDDELPPEPLDNPRRLLVWPAPDVSTQHALSERGYRPVVVHSREEVDAQIAAFPAALFVDPLTGPITRTALQSLRQAAVAAEVPVLVTAGLGQATREAAYGADPAVLLKALAPRDSEQHPPRVLLIEEHEEIALALTATLERRGMQVARAGTDADAVTLAAQMRPNLVVMDLMQVRRRRAGIIDWLRANGRLNRTPLVVYTSAGLNQAELPRLSSGETVLFLAERSTSGEVQSRIVDLLAKIGTN